jgi:hypothetical protein
MAEVVTDNVDLFVLKEETLGGLEDEFGPSFFILLRNFDLNSDLMKHEHLDVLRERVTPYIQRSVGFAEIYGMADRSGTPQVNYEVSGRRLAAVQQSLMQFGAPSTKVHHGFAKAIGEDFFEDKQKREGSETHAFDDGQKDGQLRVVVVALSPAPIGVPTRRFRSTTPADVTSFCRLHVPKAA